MVIVAQLSPEVLVADRGILASSMWCRLAGLLPRRSFEAGEAIIIPRCNMIHTWFMRFAIDVVFVKAGRVIKIIHALRPFRFAAFSLREKVRKEQ